MKSDFVSRRYRRAVGDGRLRLSQAPRLYVEAPLAHGCHVELSQPQAHYLGHVLRLKTGHQVLVFNGRDGEGSATIEAAKRGSRSVFGATIRPQTAPADLHYLFAPLKAARLDYMVQKAVEMGASRLQPVLTRHTQVTRVSTARLRANAIEAAEQCGILVLPDIGEPLALSRLIADHDSRRHVVFCDEEPRWPIPPTRCGQCRGSPLSVLIGPEGGFAEDERAAAQAAERGEARAGPADTARRHRGRRRARAGSSGDGRLERG